MNQTTALQVIEPEVIVVERLDVIATDIRQEWGKGVEAQFAIGRLLAEAWTLFGGDKVAYGRWQQEQEFPFHRNTGYNLRLASEREAEVRAYIDAVNAPQGGQRDIGVLSAMRELLTGVARVSQSDEARERRGATEGADHVGFLALRNGIHRLLGWVVNEDLVGSATRNELTQLPDDQLTELKALVEALARAFAEARKARLVAMA